jgi:RNA polymerase sigma factor (sigma-70 family)
MDKPLVEIMYKLADGKRIRLEVSSEVKDLLQQADRQIRSQRRQDRRRHTEYIDGLTDTTDILPQEDFADLVDRMDSYKRLYSAIEMLPSAQKRRLCLYYFTGLNYRQIAEIDGVNQGTAARSVDKAKKALAKLLNR